MYVQSALHFIRASVHKRRRRTQHDQVTHISWTLGGMDSQSEAAIGYVVWCCRARKMGSLLKSPDRFFCVDGATEAAKQVLTSSAQAKVFVK